LNGFLPLCIQLLCFLLIIALLLSTNYIAIEAQYHRFFCVRRYLLGRNVYLTAFKYVMMSGREGAKGEKKRVGEDTKKGEQLCGCSPFFYHIKTPR
jgi:hypothetical protein